MNDPDHGASASSPPGSIPAGLLDRIRSERFTERDWQRLAAACEHPRTRAALDQLPQISRRLLKQLPHLPSILERPRVLKVLNRLKLSRDRWSTLRRALRDTGLAHLESLVALAAEIRSAGDLWDFWHEAVLPRDRPFDLPAEVFASTVLKPLPDLASLQAEGERMARGLDRLAETVHAGQRIVFRPRSDVLITCELVAHRALWQVGDILGPGGGDVSAAEAVPLQAELRRLAGQLNAQARPDTVDLDDPRLLPIRAVARSRFNDATLAHIAQPLRDIRGRTVSSAHGAYTIFVAESEVFVQYMSSPDGTEFLCEILSHHFNSLMNPRLSDEVVTLLEITGFSWPRGEQNFARYFAVSSDQDIVALAELTAAMLSLMGGLRPDTDLIRQCHIPQARAPQMPPPGWERGDEGFDLDDEVCAEAP